MPSLPALGTLTFDAIAEAATETTLESDANPSLVGQVVNFTATVTSGGGTPAGLIQFLNGFEPLDTVDVVVGIATLSIGDLPLGQHTITAQYLGAADFTPSSDSLVQDVQ